MKLKDSIIIIQGARKSSAVAAWYKMYVKERYYEKIYEDLFGGSVLFR